MNESMNRRRLLAGMCASLLAVNLVATHGFGILHEGMSHGRIAATGFAAVLQVGLTAGTLIGITQLVRRRADRLGLFGAALTMLGVTVGSRIIGMLQLKAVGVSAMTDAIRSLEQTAPIVWVSIVPIGLMYPIGLMVLGTSIVRARAIPRTIGVMMILGGFLFPVGRIGGLMLAVYGSDFLLAFAYAWLAWQIFTRRELWSVNVDPLQREHDHRGGEQSRNRGEDQREAGTLVDVRQ